ncbi:MAG TPA: glycosyltransferase, partial [Pirellulaceae bacterium]|nr:glycosyltransferase [Pirellulaceae bacterium]
MDTSATIVVPCYNEAQRLDVARFRNFARQARGLVLRLVNDGSTDGTLELLRELERDNPRAIVVQDLPRNGGKAEAVRQGILAALRQQPCPQYIGYWDADLATPLEAIEPFIRVLDSRPDLLFVLGARLPLLGRRIERTFKRRMCGRAFAFAASLALGISVRDTQCGAKMFRVTPETRRLFDSPFSSRWIFDVEILARLLWQADRSERTHLTSTIYELPLDRWAEIEGSKL